MFVYHIYRMEFEQSLLYLVSNEIVTILRNYCADSVQPLPRTQGPVDISGSQKITAVRFFEELSEPIVLKPFLS